MAVKHAVAPQHSLLHKNTQNVHTPLSTDMWGIDWTKEMPRDFTDGVSVSYTRWEDCESFVQQSYPVIYNNDQEGTPFICEEYGSAKEVFYRRCGDFFVFKKDNRIIGVSCGNPIDWSSYYWRNFSLLPEAQGLGIYQQFFPLLTGILAAHGVDRMEGDICPSNARHIHLMNKLGGRVTGMNLSERWGTLLHFVVFLNKDNKKTFYQQFCHGWNSKAEGF